MSPNNKRSNDHGSLEDYIETTKAASPKEGEYSEAKHRLLEKIHSDEKESLMKTLIDKTILARGYFWPKAIGATTVVILIALLMLPMGNNSSNAYAQVVSRLKNAETVSLLASWFVGDQEIPTKIKMDYQYPGKKRLEFEQQGNLMINILDEEAQKGLLLYPDMKKYLVMDLVQLPSQEMERQKLVGMILNTISTLPLEINLTGKPIIVEGKKVQVFELSNGSIGIDLKENELVFIEKTFGDSKMIMTNFELDSLSVSDEDFSLVPPEQYTPMTTEVVSYDLSKTPSETDLILYLEMVSKMTKEHRFPPSLNPMDVLTLEKQGLLTGEGMEDGESQAKFAQVCQRSTIFVMKKKPTSQFHYAGDGITLNQKDTPIVWWRNSGEDVYQVIMADLTTQQMTTDQLPREPFTFR